MALPRIDVAIVAVIAAGMLWIEHGHRIVVATPAAVDAAQSAASLCPDTDDVPFSTDCIKFIDGGVFARHPLTKECGGEPARGGIRCAWARRFACPRLPAKQRERSIQRGLH